MQKKDSIGRILLGRNYDGLDKSFRQMRTSLNKSRKTATDYNAFLASLIEQDRKLVFDLLKKGKL